MTFEDKVKHQYKGEIGKEYHEAVHFIPESIYPWISKLRAKKISPNINKDDIVVEYGVGYGWNLAELECKQRVGFDISEHGEAIVRSHDIHFVNKIQDIPNEYANVVICHHVLEHVPNPSESLEDIYRILCHSGKLLLFVPYEKEWNYRYFDPKEPNHHLYSWNVQTLGNLVEAIGFRVNNGRLMMFGYDRFAAYWANRFRLGEIGCRFIWNLIRFIRPVFEVHIVAIKD